MCILYMYVEYILKFKIYLLVGTHITKKNNIPNCLKQKIKFRRLMNLSSKKKHTL